VATNGAATALAFYPRPVHRGEEIAVRAADLRDVDWLTQNDGHLDATTLAAKVENVEMLVAEVGGEKAGLLRFDRLWSQVPFVAQVRVAEGFRRTGVGRALMQALADAERSRNTPFILSSATGDETEPQAWHRAIGFEECGELSGINANGASEVVFRLSL
jgi:GNAT superfamily N-acetyltransferase